MNSKIKNYLNQTQDSSSLALFRIGFGVLMTFGMIRFLTKGWVEKLYLEPSFHFSFYGFEWIKPIGDLTYLLFFICTISALFIALGYKYRISIIIFFLSFTYIELMDKTTYLNHYYFISILSFLMIFLPANAYYSLDSRNRGFEFKKIPKWCTDCIKMLLFIVYFYSGLAKINSDWLLEAQPLKIWLTSSYDLPIIGSTLMQQNWVHYGMSWGGMFYDLLIAFLLLYSRTRIIAFCLVIFFHVFTAILFPIGMFPYIMIVGSLIFFDPQTHYRMIKKIDLLVKFFGFKDKKKSIISTKSNKNPFVLAIVTIFFIIQLSFPFRYLLYPGELFWNEQGYRFSWRVMLMEKKGITNLKVLNKNNGNSFIVMNDRFLSEFQERQMSFQPDFILEYAHHVGEYYKKNGLKEIEIYADSYVTLNGRLSQRFIDPKVNLLDEERGFKHKKWVLALDDEITGL